MGNGTLGEIRIFAGTFLPQSWAYCDGAVLKRGSNTRLSSVLGRRFGGDGHMTFALPKMADPAPGLKYIICTAGRFPGEANG
jgi:microcystin-dependent protein